jgi:hypothetical protein
VPKSEVAFDDEKATLVEVRTENHQSVLPPPLHPDGQRYEWVSNGEPAAVKAEALYRVATLAAVAGAVALKWPQGDRQDAALALSGYFRRCGVTEQEAEAVLYAVGTVAQDEETEKRLTALRDTYAKPEGEALTGLPTLATLFPEELVNWLQRTLSSPKSADGVRPTSQATRLVSVAQSAELFYTPGAEPEMYATFPVNGRRVTAPLRSRGFRLWLTHQLYLTEGKTPGADAVKDALTVLEAQAELEGPAIPVYTRVAEQEGAIYVDLANERGEVIQITPCGWTVTADTSIRFRQPKGMLPLPYPVAGGSLAELRTLFNIGPDADWVLLKGWIVQAYRPRGPYPPLALNGEQGSAKTTLAILVRRLFDPH